MSPPFSVVCFFPTRFFFSYFANLVYLLPEMRSFYLLPVFSHLSSCFALFWLFFPFPFLLYCLIISRYVLVLVICGNGCECAAIQCKLLVITCILSFTLLHYFAIVQFIMNICGFINVVPMVLYIKLLLWYTYMVHLIGCLMDSSSYSYQALLNVHPTLTQMPTNLCHSVMFLWWLTAKVKNCVPDWSAI